MKKNLLKEAMLQHKLIAFRTEREKWGESIIGYIVELTDNNITVNEIDEIGSFNGFSTFKLDSIVDIVMDDKTLRCLTSLNTYNKQIFANTTSTIWGIGDEIKNHIFQMKQRNELFTLFVEDDETSVIGFVNDFDDNSVLIDMVDNYGEKNGKILIPYEIITGVRCKSAEDQARLILYNHNYNA